MSDPTLQPPPEAPSGTLLGSLGDALATLTETLFTRLELLFVELQEGLEGLVGLVLWAFVALLAAGMGLFIGALALIFAFWDTHRLLVSLLAMAAFLAVSGAAALVVLGRLRAQRHWFAATLAEFARDREHLESGR